jgi:hypothetical protein
VGVREARPVTGGCSVVATALQLGVSAVAVGKFSSGKRQKKGDADVVPDPYLYPQGTSIPLPVE